MFIDCHCHIDLYKNKIKNIVDRARNANVLIIVNNGINKEANRKTLEIAFKFKEIKAALGIYPIDGLKMSDIEIKEEINFIRENKNKIIAIGEVGLDLKESEELEKQKNIFRKMVKLAIELNKPIIIHSRKAENQCVDILEQEKAKKVIMHCFSGSMKLVQRIIDNKWSLTIPAIVKYSEHFQNIVKITPVEQLLCETDSPFLHPDKKRDNEPKNIIESYKKIAEIKKMELKNVEKQIEKNWRKMFIN